MEKKKKYYTKRFKMPHLFREDLESIEYIIQNELKPKEYELETEDFKFSGVNEIPQDLPGTNQLQIHTRFPNIHIDFLKYEATIYRGDDDLNTVGAVTKLTEIISQRERKFLFSISANWWGLAAALISCNVSILILIEQLKKAITDLKMWVCISVIVLSVTWIILVFRNSFNFSEVEFIYRKDNPRFSVKYQDQIILLVLGAVLTALFTVLIQIIIH